MIKKQYTEPEIAVTKFNIFDVILTSPMTPSTDPGNFDNEESKDAGGFFT